MAPLPRILTVDPTGAVARMVRAALNLIDRTVIQVDVPGGAEALEEVYRGEFRLVVSTLAVGESMKGFELALRVKQAQPDTGMILLADINDPEDLDQETREASPFIYLHRPVDPHQFIRVLSATLNGSDLLTAAYGPASPREGLPANAAPIPALDLKAAQNIVDSLLTDVGAMAIVLANRSGAVLLERGAVGYIDREQLTSVLLPSIHATMAISALVGGRTSALQVFDGDTYDIYVLSIGYHHFMCLIFDGQIGGRQLGAVNRYGRRAAEDLIAMIGASALQIQRPAPPQSAASPDTSAEPEATVEPAAERAESFEPEPMPSEPEPLKLEPIENLDLHIFDHKPGKRDEELADDLFAPEKLAEIANETRRDRGPLSYDEARELGIIP
jgi:DNA-binding NarL/FixJ family response regulator